MFKSPKLPQEGDQGQDWSPVVLDGLGWDAESFLLTPSVGSFPPCACSCDSGMKPLPWL